jgi:hypothetical protein
MMRRLSQLLPLAALVVAAVPACGNYSNEDLEYMSAIPQRDDVAIEVPRRGLLVTLGAAEGWRTTLDVTRALNRTADAFLGLIDAIRNNAPTRRLPDQRVWGPFPADQHPGWQVEFRMHRTVVGGEAVAFDYALAMIPPAGVTLPGNARDTVIIGGTFAASGGVRVGEGHMEISLVDARAAGLVFRDLDSLRTLTIAYSTRTWPRMVTMHIENEPSETEAASADYSYQQAENGDGRMTFSLPKDIVSGPLGPETLSVQSRWLGDGQGRADISVTGGDVVGEATSAECWGDDFQSTYKTQSWAPLDTTGSEGACPFRS